jgi:hypothetical protein
MGVRFALAECSGVSAGGEIIRRTVYEAIVFSYLAARRGSEIYLIQMLGDVPGLTAKLLAISFRQSCSLVRSFDT